MVPVSLRPLQELEIVLHLALHQLLHGDRTVDMVLAEEITQYLEILEIRIFAFRIELYAAERSVEEDAVVHLYKCSAGKASVNRLWRLWQRGSNIPSATLLDFGQVQLQQAVQPSQQFLSTSPC